MNCAVPTEIEAQLGQALPIIVRHLEPALSAVHLYGSALDGGLKPYSDIDLLVLVTAPLQEAVRRSLCNELLEVSAPPGQSDALRALEVTVLVHDDVIPWRYPAKRELQFGEWQRNDILAGVFERPMVDADLAILLTQARQRSIALVGPAAKACFDSVPTGDLRKAFAHTLTLWNSPQDWVGDERNVVLALARIWYSLVTGEIVPKDAAANWAIERLPVQHRSILLEARQAYLGQAEDRLAARADQLEAFVHFVKREAAACLAS
jgi:streptomycin 3"-adenylyltransferase